MVIGTRIKDPYAKTTSELGKFSREGASQINEKKIVSIGLLLNVRVK